MSQSMTRICRSDPVYEVSEKYTDTVNALKPYKSTLSRFCIRSIRQNGNTPYNMLCVYEKAVRRVRARKVCFTTVYSVYPVYSMS